MPVLKPVPYTEFDPKNPVHVAELMKINNGRSRDMELKFNFPPPFTNGVDYAKHLMAKAWMEHMAQLHTEVFHAKGSTTIAADYGSTPSGNIVALGIRSKPLQQNASRGLPPGTTLG